MLLCLGTTPTVQRTMSFPRVLIDQVNRATTVLDSASGKSINVARVLHTLGESVIATGFLGGQGGALIRRDLEAAGIPHDFVTVAQNTRTCTTVIDLSTTHATELVQEHAVIDPADWDQLRAKLAGLIPQSRIVVLSGSLPPQAPQDFYADCLKIANQHHIPVILDGRGTPLRHAMPHRPWVVKPNRAELAETVGFAIDTRAALRTAITQLIAGGPQWAVITMGPQGAVVSDGQSFWHLHVPKIESVNPIGSGDSFAAGIAAALSRGQAMPEAARLGAACAVANALTPLPGHIHLSDVERLRPQITLDPM